MRTSVTTATVMTTQLFELTERVEEPAALFHHELVSRSVNPIITVLLPSLLTKQLTSKSVWESNQIHSCIHCRDANAGRTLRHFQALRLPSRSIELETRPGFLDLRGNVHCALSNFHFLLRSLTSFLPLCSQDQTPKSAVRTHSSDSL